MPATIGPRSVLDSTMADLGMQQAQPLLDDAEQQRQGIGTQPVQPSYTSQVPGLESLIGATGTGSAAPNGVTPLQQPSTAPAAGSGFLSSMPDLNSLLSPFGIGQPAAQPNPSMQSGFTPAAGAFGVPSAMPTGVPATAPGAPVADGGLQAKARAFAQKYNLDPERFVQQIQTESQFNPAAVNPNSGAAGLGQFMPATAQGLGIDPMDPDQSLEGAARYMRQMLDANGGDYRRALAAYNWGPGNVARWDGSDESLPEETRRYIQSILSAPAATTQPVTPPQAEQTPQAQQQTVPEDIAQSALDDPQKWALCGPVAAVIAATRRGGKWSVAEAKKIAQDQGLWDFDNGMHGLQSQVDLLNQMGLGARTGAADQSTLAADAQAGNTPIISTNKHYFILKGYNAQTGQFDTTTSGEVLKGGSRWLTLDQINSLGGGIQGAAYMDNPASPQPSAVAPPSQAATPESRREADALALNAPSAAPADAQQPPSSGTPGAGQPPAPGVSALDDARATNSGGVGLAMKAPQPGTSEPINNPDGSVTTERSITVTDDRLNDGRATNIPTVWGGRIVSDDEAIQNAANSGIPFDSFGSVEDAVRAAEQRSHDLGAGQATSVGGARVPSYVQNTQPYRNHPVRGEPIDERQGNVQRDALMLRQPLDPNPEAMSPDSSIPPTYGIGPGDGGTAPTPYEQPYNPDDGPRESGYTVNGYPSGGEPTSVPEAAIPPSLPSGAPTPISATGSAEAAPTSAPLYGPSESEAGPAMVPGQIIPSYAPQAAQTAPFSPQPFVSPEAASTLSAIDENARGFIDQQRAQVDRYMELSEKRANQRFYGGPPLTDEEQAEFNQLSDDMAANTIQEPAKAASAMVAAHVAPGTHLGEAIGNAGRAVGEAAQGVGTRVREGWEAGRQVARDLNAAPESGAAAYGTFGQAPEPRMRSEFGTRIEEVPDNVRGPESVERVQAARGETPYDNSAVPPNFDQQPLARVDAPTAADINLNASAGAAPPTRATDRLGAVNNVLGQGVASSISGGVGAQVNQQANPDDPYAGLKGFAGGALVPQLATRGVRAGLRAAGRDVGGARGALSVFGGRPANEAASAAPNPVMQRMARQMAGQHAPSGIVNKRGLAERWAQAMTDDRAGIRNFQEAVSRSIGRPLTAGESVAELTRVNPASVASQRLDEGLKGALQAVGDDEDYLAQYLVHSHNVDVAREMGQRAYTEATAAGATPQAASRKAMAATSQRQFSGDLRLTETVQQLQDIEQRVKSLPDGADRWQAIKDGAQAVWDFNRQTLERKKDAGIISDALYTDLTTKYPKYVRTDIADYFDKGTGGPAPGGKRLGLSDIGIQKISAAGTTKERVNPLLSTIDQTYASESAIARNEAGKAFEELVRLDPSWQSTFKEVTPSQGVNRGNPATTVPSSYSLKNGEQFLRVWDKGQARTYVIPPEYAALVSPQSGRVLGDSGAAKLLTGAMNVYKSLITSKNPAFSLIVSPLRDAGDYAIREGALSAKSRGPLGFAQGAASAIGAMSDYAKAVPDAFAGILEGTYKGDLARMMREGAGQGARPGRDQRDLRNALRELQSTGGLEVKSAGDVARLVGNILTLGAEPIGGRLEQVPRLAAARRAERRGAAPLGQAMAFRDATVDFQRAGEWSRVANSVIPFFNVAMQGGAQTVRTARQNPLAFMGAVAATVGTATMAAEAWNNSDAQRKADYQDVPDYLKKTGIVLMIPGMEGSNERGDRLPNYAWIPTGQYGALVQTAKEAARNYVESKPGTDLSTGRGWLDLGADVAGIFSPIRGDSAGAVATSLVPPGMSTAVDLAADKDLYRGSTIATDRRDEQASALSQGSAKAFNAVTGQETRPSQWEYAYRDLGGYGATLALEGSNLLAEKAGMRRPKEEDRVQNTPVVGGLINRVVRDSGGQRLQTATEDSERVPQGIRDTLEEVGLRRDQVMPVSSKYKGATLTREEQERWQDLTNSLVEREISQVRRSSDWRARGADRQRIIQDAISTAKQTAADRALRRLTDHEIERRIRQQESRKAS